MMQPPSDPESTRNPNDRPLGNIPVGDFLLQLFYLAVLIALFVLYETWTGFQKALPPDLGSLPIEVPWFGALGGSLISFSGIFLHSCKWDPCYRYWHYTRPLIGAVIGSLGALVFFLLSDTASTGANAGAVNATTFDVVAFLVGYREASFRELIKRVTDLLLKPAESSRPANAPTTTQAKTDDSDGTL
jgi:hypothetical protein